MNDRWDMRILHGTYTIESEEVIIELYGRTRATNQSIAVRFHDFHPYFQFINPPERAINDLRDDPKVRHIERLTLLVKGREQPAAKVTVRNPWEVPNYRKRYSQYARIYAADIPFAMRFIFDMDLGSCTTVIGEEVTNGPTRDKYSTDLVVTATSFERCEPFKPDLKILSFDIENSWKLNTIYCLCCAIRDPGAEELRYEQFTGSDVEIIKQFNECVKKEDPDVLTGYNIVGYDLSELEKKAKEISKLQVLLSRDTRPIKHLSERNWRIYGRVVADAWLGAKSELRPKKESLNHIAKLVLGEEKHDVDPSKIEEEWANDQEKVIKYCTKDAELALLILEKIGVLQKAMDLATVSRLPVDDIINGRTSQMIDSILIRAADHAAVGVPCTHHTTRTSKIEGGYVHSLKPDLYHWVCVLDFRSMYPSIIIANNICYTTLSDDGAILAPNGARFLTKDQRPGLLPVILEKLMDDREDAKIKMREAHKEGDEDTYAYYNGLQDAIKILMNSFYGVFASSFYRFTDPDIGAAITAFARENITRIIKLLGDEGLEVIYSDTDSIFFRSPYDELPPTIEFGTKISKRFSKDGAILEFEKILDPFFSHGKKKRYIGKVLWPEEQILVRGYETRRTDAFDLLSEGLQTIFDHILSGNIDEVVPISRQIISDLRRGDVPVEKLVISKTAKAAKEYKNPENQANVQAMRKLKKLGYDFVYGMKVSYIVTNARKTPQEVEPYIDGRPFEHKPDWDYYAERVALALARVTDVFGWDERTLLTGIQQRSLFSSEFETTTPTAKETLTDGVPVDASLEKRKAKRAQQMKVKKKSFTLDDFM